MSTRPDTAVKKLVCRGCGADVRETSAFCYNCGEPVTAQPVSQTEIRADTSQSNQTRETVEKETVKGNRADELFAAKLRDTTNSKAEKLSKLQTASALRRKTKVFNRKPTEVVWVERGDSPMMFVIVSAVLTLFAALLLFLAFYLR